MTEYTLPKAYCKECQDLKDHNVLGGEIAWQGRRPYSAGGDVIHTNYKIFLECTACKSPNYELHSHHETLKPGERSLVKSIFNEEKKDQDEI